MLLALLGVVRLGPPWELFLLEVPGEAQQSISVTVKYVQSVSRNCGTQMFSFTSMLERGSPLGIRHGDCAEQSLAGYWAELGAPSHLS